MTEQNPPAGKPQFTPGPWVWDSFGDIEAADYHAIATTEGMSDRDIANARLMAAAPNLYAALEEIVDYSDNPISAHEVAQNHKDAGDPISVPEALAIIKDAHDARIARARAALAKARGEAE